MKTVNPAPDCEYQRGKIMNGVLWCFCNWHPCDRTETCGYDPIQVKKKKQVSMEDVLSMKEECDEMALKR